MPTKAGKIQLKDLRASKTIFILGFEFFPAFRRVIPYLKAMHLDNEYIRTIPKDQWANILAENRVYASRHAAERFMRLHGKEMLREENRWQMEVLRKVSRKGPSLDPAAGPMDENGDQEVPVYSPQEVDSWMAHCEELYDWQIETFPLGLPMVILVQGMHIKLRGYVRQKIVTGSGRDVMSMAKIEDPVAQQVNQLEAPHEQPVEPAAAVDGQGV